MLTYFAGNFDETLEGEKLIIVKRQRKAEADKVEGWWSESA